jgi:hypothetical protein
MFASGYNGDDLHDPYRDVAVLHKPYDIAEVKVTLVVPLYRRRQLRAWAAETARRERRSQSHARLSALPEWCTMAGSPGWWSVSRTLYIVLSALVPISDTPVTVPWPMALR